ncbi:unnamed protein product [Cylindrotheca closterium]|uniref:Sulfotransferase n=1 Tax=Cylindrotheca closterium TaxID=2856 RepID=A0AAD2FJW5_9STRA|nr:unnamed protein product [Cylindrotheca closterium]
MESSLSSAFAISTRQRKHPAETTEVNQNLKHQAPVEETKKEQGPFRCIPTPLLVATRRKFYHIIKISAMVLLVIAAGVVQLGSKPPSAPPIVNHASPGVRRNFMKGQSKLAEEQSEKPTEIVGATDDAFSITNINTTKVYPLESLGIQSAIEFYKKGMRQRSKPFSLAQFHVDVTCKTPISLVQDVQPPHHDWKKRAPHVLILGAQKGGTTAMAYYLYNHPRFIYLPSKELHFFDDDMDAWQNDGDSASSLTNLNGNDILNKYHSESMSKDYNMTIFQQQQKVNPAYIMDATPNYLFESDRVPQRVLCACGPWVKLLVFLRNPVDRAWSQYYMQHNYDSLGNLTNLPSFEEYVEMDMNVLAEVGVLPPDNADLSYYGSAGEAKAWKTYTRLGINSPLGRGLYSIQLRQWLKAMKDYGKPSSDLMVFSSEQMKVLSKAIYHQVLEFLELPPYEISHFDRVHKTRYGDNVKMKPETRKKLEIFFRPYNQQLKDVLGSEWDGIWDEA